MTLRDTRPYHFRPMNLPGRLRGRVFPLLLSALAVLAVVGHICALPLHAHAGVITTHETHDSHGDNPDPDKDAAHPASCEVVKASSNPDGPMAALVLVGAVSAAVPPPVRPPVQAAAARIIGSPPLFLLHAALLI